MREEDPGKAILLPQRKLGISSPRKFLKFRCKMVWCETIWAFDVNKFMDKLWISYLLTIPKICDTSDNPGVMWGKGVSPLQPPLYLICACLEFDVSGVLDDKTVEWLEAIMSVVGLSLFAILKQYHCRISVDLHIDTSADSFNLAKIIKMLISKQQYNDRQTATTGTRLTTLAITTRPPRVSYTQTCETSSA